MTLKSTKMRAELAAAEALRRQQKRQRPVPYTTYGKRGLPLATIQRLHWSQDGRCANPGCRMPIKAFGRTRAVDHEHDGQPRGMLCKACSMALANTGRSPRRLVGLLAYLGVVSDSVVPK